MHYELNTKRINLEEALNVSPPAISCCGLTSMLGSGAGCCCLAASMSVNRHTVVMAAIYNTVVMYSRWWHTAGEKGDKEIHPQVIRTTIEGGQREQSLTVFLAVLLSNNVIVS